MQYILKIVALLFFLSFSSLFAQRVGFVNSETIRDKFPEAKRAEQRIESIVEDWKRELTALQEQIDQLQYEIKQNRLIWTDTERIEKENKLSKLQKQKNEFATKKFEPGGEYDETVKLIQQPVELKIFSAVQQVSSEEGFDIIWDQSIQPLAYVNFKYDLTVKVLRKLGVNVEDLEADLKEKIEKDPRNRPKKRSTSSRRSRSRAKNDPNASTDTETNEGSEEEEEEKREIER